MNEQLSLTGVATPRERCGHVKVVADDRAGEYRLTCVRLAHGDDVPHDLVWLTRLRRIDPVVVTGERL